MVQNIQVKEKNPDPLSQSVKRFDHVTSKLLVSVHIYSPKIIFHRYGKTI